MRCCFHRMPREEGEAIVRLKMKTNLHILSFVNAKYAVQTCILSKRWENLWKHLQTLIIHDSPDVDFLTLPNFVRFVSRLLTLRDDPVALHGLDFELNLPIQSNILETIAEYVVSHNVQQLGLTVMCDIRNFPSCIFSSQTLTSLKLNVKSTAHLFKKMLFPKSLNLPALTALHLEHFAFCANGNDRRAEPFSSLNKLNSLIIVSCILRDAKILSISSTTLCNLTVHSRSRDYLYSIELSSPNLRTFAFTGVPFHFLSGRSNLSSLEQVNIDAKLVSIEEAKIDLETCLNYPMSPFILLSWLEELANIKSLTTSASTLQVLSLIPHLLEVKYPILGSLKSLKVIRKPLSHGFIKLVRQAKLQNLTTKSGNAATAMLKGAIKEELFLSIPDGIVDFLLQNSPSAKVDIICCSTQVDTL